MDSIIAYSLMVLSLGVLILSVSYLVSILDFKYENHYRRLVHIKKNILLVIVIYLNVVNLLVTIFPLKVNLYIISQWFLTIYATALFAYNMVYSKTKNENMLLDYMSEVFKTYDLKTLFNVSESSSKYREESDIMGQPIVKVNVEGKTLFYLKNSDWIFVPNHEFTKNELNYLYYYLNYHFDFSNIEKIMKIPFEFEKNTGFYKYISRELFVYKYKTIPDKIDFWKTKYFEKIALILFTLILSVLFIFVFFHQLSHEFGWQRIIDLLDLISSWLFESR